MNPTPPADLDDRAQAHWITLFGQLNGMGVVEEQDRAALRILCILLGRFDEAVQQRMPEGLDPSCIEAYLRAQDNRVEKLVGRIESLLKAFGLTPASRPNVHGKAKEAPATKGKFLKLGGATA